MKKCRQIFLTTALVAFLTAGGLAIIPLASAASADAQMPADMKMSHDMPMPTTAEDHSAEAAKYDEEATSLEAKADLHAKMAARYRTLASSTSRRRANFQYLANHCARLAKSYRGAAIEARAMAESHRNMAKTD